MQLFVLGMHRSGTSALSRILNLMGVYFGGESVGHRPQRGKRQRLLGTSRRS